MFLRGVGSETLSLTGRPLKRKKKSELTDLPDLLGPGSEPRDPHIIPFRYPNPVTLRLSLPDTCLPEVVYVLVYRARENLG